MPELPEVQTTVDGLNKYLVGKKITSVWSDYNSSYFDGKENIKNKKYFSLFKKTVLNSPIKKSERVGKNILIHLKNGTSILVHMKMTGHFLYGEYKKNNKGWLPKESGALRDPFNRHIRLVLGLDNGKSLVLSDMRKFAKVMFIKTKALKDHPDISNIAPDPFQLSMKGFIEKIRQKKSGRIKNILMDQSLVSGIGNIYSDEVLFNVDLHPETDISAINEKKLGEIWVRSKKILSKGIDLGGDSTSDYRNIEGKRGNFQKKHQVYRRSGQSCPKRGCLGKIIRKVVGGRSAHFCNKHQKLVETKIKK